jgi:hypothetical protein
MTNLIDVDTYYEAQQLDLDSHHASMLDEIIEYELNNDFDLEF